MTKKIRIGNIIIGGGERVAVQSMTTVKTSDISATLAQIDALECAGADIVRVAVNDEADARAIKEIKREKAMPIVADIQQDYKLAILSVKCGADKIRVNPGYLGERNIEPLSKYLKEYGIPVRVGTNTGSINSEFLQKYGKNEVSLCESALKDIGLFEKYGVEDIVISVKASDVPLTVKAYRYISKRTDYPLHLGVTEAGTLSQGIVKSSIGIGSLLLDGIGDTIRVSLTADPVEEIYAAKRILRSVGLENNFADVISCPTCGRCGWDLIGLAKEVEKLTLNIEKPLKIAVMGCAVNGPGEASGCEIGIAGAGKHAVIFKKGEVFKKVLKENALEEFLKEIRELL